MLTASLTMTQWVCIVLLALIALILLISPQTVWRSIYGKNGKEDQPDGLTFRVMRVLGVLILVGIAYVCWRMM